mmetsp:Transcript_2092/g.5328  ORF Transcript_2092/g.5328 Transcript_2092/m.5328 type:complete len:159 (-) Transcript_2092:290-766(-)
MPRRDDEEEEPEKEKEKERRRRRDDDDEEEEEKEADDDEDEKGADENAAGNTDAGAGAGADEPMLQVDEPPVPVADLPDGFVDRVTRALGVLMGQSNAEDASFSLAEVFAAVADQCTADGVEAPTMGQLKGAIDTEHGADELKLKCMYDPEADSVHIM